MKKKPGRPPAGLDGKQKVKHYPQLSVRVPEEIVALFKALTGITTQTRMMVKILEEHVECMLLPDQIKIRQIQRRILERMRSQTAKR